MSIKNITNAKLTEAQVIEARATHVTWSRTLSIRALAKRYGVSERALSRAITGESWGHVKQI